MYFTVISLESVWIGEINLVFGCMDIRKALKQIWEDCGPPSFYLYFKWKSKPVTHG